MFDLCNELLLIHNTTSLTRTKIFVSFGKKTMNGNTSSVGKLINSFVSNQTNSRFDIIADNISYTIVIIDQIMRNEIVINYKLYFYISLQ